MDILISSNLERLLYFTAGAEATNRYMSQLKDAGKYTIEKNVLDKICNDFVGYYANESETAATIKDMYNNYGYLCDTHTAVAIYCANKYISDTGDNTPIITASTASPYKFARDVFKSLTDKCPSGDLEALTELNELTNEPIPYPLANIDKRTIRFTDVIEANDMGKTVLKSI